MISGNRYMSWKMGMVCLICFLLYKYITTVVPLEIYKQDNIMPKKRKYYLAKKWGKVLLLHFNHIIHIVLFISSLIIYNYNYITYNMALYCPMYG